MLIDLNSRTAVVTGGSRGIGRAIVERLARSGANVALVARRQDVIDEAIADIRKKVTTSVAGFSCDVSDRTQIERTMQRIEEDFGGADILINNAGSSARRPFEQIDTAFAIADYDLKLQSAIRFSQLAIPNMRRKNWGRIINVVSIFGKAPQGGSAPTSIHRAAGIALTKVMSAELAKDNILVNALCPGAIHSDQWPRNHRNEAPQLTYEEFLRMRSKDIPLNRLGEAEEFANVACFLASDAASYITGTAINVDGGRCPVT
jgi:NAD(P)-dependent dehydrogenase (short-subunit alcohol dehydrogenase family)